jgi:non-heme chloroperoxidase
MHWSTGLPVVLLAGWAFNWTISGEHIAALTVRGFRCVALDRRSHGRSDAASRGYDLDTLAGDVAALFEERDLRDVVIVAYSMGSIVAVRYLTRLWHARASHARICRPNDTVPDEDRGQS